MENVDCKQMERLMVQFSIFIGQQVGHAVGSIPLNVRYITYFQLSNLCSQVAYHFHKCTIVDKQPMYKKRFPGSSYTGWSIRGPMVNYNGS